MKDFQWKSEFKQHEAFFQFLNMFFNRFESHLTVKSRKNVMKITPKIVLRGIRGVKWRVVRI